MKINSFSINIILSLYVIIFILFILFRNDEIVMPAEQTGIVKDNYMWKVTSVFEVVSTTIE